MDTSDEPFRSNPYSSPREISDSEEPLTQDVSESKRLNFHTDWSIAGLRAKRKRPHHRMMNLLFAGITVLGLATFALQYVNDSSSTFGLCCFFGYVWFLYLIMMIPTWSYQSANAFAQNAPGWIGEVRVRIEQGFCCLIGPMMSVTLRGTDCTKWRWDHDRVSFQIPSIPELLPLLNTDLTHRERLPPAVTHPSTDESKIAPRVVLVRQAAAMVQQMGLPLTSSTTPSTVPHRWRFFDGTLCGKSFRGTDRYRVWFMICLMTAALAIVTLLWAVSEYQSMAAWVIDPPPHYQRSDSEQLAMISVWFAIVISAAFLVTALWYFIKMRRRFGSYAVAIGDDAVLIASDKVCHGYHRQGLGHFKWTVQGLAVCGVNGIEPTFLIPVDWMDEDAIRYCQKRFAPEGRLSADITCPPKSQVYISPKV